MERKDYFKLSDDWLTEGLIDLEYKKYSLLSYLQGVDKRFDKLSLYPPFSDILFHYGNLLKFKENNSILLQNFPKTLSSVDLGKLRLFYERKFEDPDFMEELKKIIDFALPALSKKIQTGKDIYDKIEDSIVLEPVGICPLNQNEGYLLINVANDKYVHVFEYQVSFFNTADSEYRGIHTKFLDKMRRSISNTFESIKLALIKKHKKLPNPATFLVAAKTKSPLEETLLPISKRMLIQKLSA